MLELELATDIIWDQIRSADWLESIYRRNLLCRLLQRPVFCNL